MDSLIAMSAPLTVAATIAALWIGITAGGRKAKRNGGEWHALTGRHWSVQFRYTATPAENDSAYSMCICRQ